MSENTGIQITGLSAFASSLSRVQTDTANESVDYFWREGTAKYSTYADYVMENARSSHRLFNTEEEWQENKNIVLNITDSTKDGITVQQENNKTNVRSTNMPTYT